MNIKDLEEKVEQGDLFLEDSANELVESGDIVVGSGASKPENSDGKVRFKKLSYEDARKILNWKPTSEAGMRDLLFKYMKEGSFLVNLGYRELKHYQKTLEGVAKKISEFKESRYQS